MKKPPDMVLDPTLKPLLPGIKKYTGRYPIKKRDNIDSIKYI